MTDYLHPICPENIMALHGIYIAAARMNTDTEFEFDEVINVENLAGCMAYPEKDGKIYVAYSYK